MTSPVVPYYAAIESLPVQLPTLEEIHSSKEFMSDQEARMVVGVGEHFVVKYGEGVDLIEGETILHLESTVVPTPRIYAWFQDQSTKKNYIIMERIKGQVLASMWSDIPKVTKEAIATRLRSILNDMRKLPSPDQDYPFCSVGRRGLPDGIFWTSDPAAPFAGPFKTEQELNEAMIAKYRQDGMSTERGNYYSRVFQQLFRDHPAVFTHGDLQRKNIMIRDLGDENKEPDIVLIDFEYSGWYPSYWEYSRAIYACGRWSDDWNLSVETFLKPAYVEYAWTELLLRELWT
ncbi:kinase-like protein [Cucurbitaria berberidis CBS 394.84]|uniref:Kinase-like protein n=1 Tax=Cucurbitaria berberidis CBS 394.84 TaxID=1168544 RepID=A0A9P4GP88_9PLEO|nr:kinase-like protein [Cucurbitaria berberidis CBS 394.84]KAF1848650.1 kinase-like protein [Cucurbitaria berberidis CBS 394.84]